MKAVGSFIILRKAQFSFFVFLHFDTENFMCDFVVTYATFLKIQTYLSWQLSIKSALETTDFVFQTIPKAL